MAIFNNKIEDIRQHIRIKDVIKHRKKKFFEEKMQISEIEKYNQIELTNEMDLTPVAIEKLALMPANDILA